MFNELFFRPLFNLLIVFYNFIPDIGVAIIFLTVFVKLILLPLSRKMINSQREMALLQPKIKEVQVKNKNNREAQSRALLNLYREHKINPFAGFILLAIQIPVLFALFKVFRVGFDQSSLAALYSFIGNPGEINPMFLGFLDLNQNHNLYLSIFAAVSQFWQAKVMSLKTARVDQNSKTRDFSSLLNKQFIYVLPIVIAFISYSWPAAISLYWTTFNLFAIFEHYIAERFPYKEKHKTSD